MVRYFISSVNLRVVFSAFFIALFYTTANAQELPTTSLKVETRTGEHTFTVEVADNDAERAKGLMHRTELGADQGMLFWFPSPRPITMWMKDTPLSLDMIFIKQDGIVHHIAADTVPFSLHLINSEGEVSAVLEVLAGTAKRIDLKPGDKITLK